MNGDHTINDVGTIFRYETKSMAADAVRNAVSERMNCGLECVYVSEMCVQDSKGDYRYLMGGAVKDIAKEIPKGTIVWIPTHPNSHGMKDCLEDAFIIASRTDDAHHRYIVGCSPANYQFVMEIGINTELRAVVTFATYETDPSLPIYSEN